MQQLKLHRQHGILAPYDAALTLVLAARISAAGLQSGWYCEVGQRRSLLHLMGGDFRMKQKSLGIISCQPDTSMMGKEGLTWAGERLNLFYLEVRVSRDPG
jgi:hypothetical protein